MSRANLCRNGFDRLEGCNYCCALRNSKSECGCRNAFGYLVAFRIYRTGEAVGAFLTCNIFGYGCKCSVKHYVLRAGNMSCHRCGNRKGFCISDVFIIRIYVPCDKRSRIRNIYRNRCRCRSLISVCSLNRKAVISHCRESSYLKCAAVNLKISVVITGCNFISQFVSVNVCCAESCNNHIVNRCRFEINTAGYIIKYGSRICRNRTGCSRYAGTAGFNGVITVRHFHVKRCCTACNRRLVCILNCLICRRVTAVNQYCCIFSDYAGNRSGNRIVAVF